MSDRNGRNERDAEREAGQPDPTHDTWSAWLPQLDRETPLPQADAPPESAVPPAPASPLPTVPQPPLPQASRPPRPTAASGWPPPPRPASGLPPRSSAGAYPRMAPPAAQVYSAPPPNRLALAILCTIMCFTPFGIVAIVKATSVRSKWAMGQFDEAYRASRSVKTWCLLAALAWPGLAIFFACTGVLTHSL
ncbi:hypothetical protein GCM10009740_41010 [Terrabacter terrae]|uniref:Interferon-induced transmembrane protein n=1 Tax=Terrabacter terrae TaxID=318434 RepID=A0ABN1ZY46_9MICO